MEALLSLVAWCNIEFYYSYSNPLYYAENLYLNGELVTELTIPNTVAVIKDYAFYNCRSLVSITCHAAIPPTLFGAPFYGVSTSIPVYVPANSVDTYREAEGWKWFTNIVGIEAGIADVTVDEDADAPIYTMKGVRVNGTRSTLPAGLYIQNGKKFVVM